MMGFGPDEARRLSYWEYTAMLTVWNKRHETQSKVDGDTMPDPELVEMMKGRMH